MKTLKKLFCLFIFSIGAITFGQNTDQKHKLSFRSFSITPIEVYFNSNSGGGAITGDLSFSSGKNIFTFSGSIGEEFVIWGTSDTFQQLNILYGREYKLNDWLFFDTHAGVGLFLYNSNGNNFTGVGIPIVAKLRFKTGKKFSLGFKIQDNINSAYNIFSVGILLQWNWN